MPDSTNPAETVVKKKKQIRKQEARKFLGTDAEFMSKSRVKHKHFTVKLPQFTAFDADFDITYANNWVAKIEFCESITSDKTTVNQLEIIKGNLDLKVSELTAKVNEVEFYALKAFKDEPGILHEFQFNKVNRPDQYSKDFIINVYVIHLIAQQDYLAELTTAGMPPSLLTELDTIKSEVSQLELEHEKFKRTRIKRTRLRIKDMNELFDYYDTVRRAAQIIFVDNPIEAELFVIK
jgi:hypothetical protein